MSKSKEIKKTQDIVMEVLKALPATRNSDDLLYVKVCEQICGMQLDMPFYKVFLNRKKYGFPSYETVGRARRKIQEHYPELAAVADVEAERTVNEGVFRDYGRKVSI